MAIVVRAELRIAPGTREEFLHRIGKVAEITSADLHGYLAPTLEAWVAERSFAHAYPPLR